MALDKTPDMESLTPAERAAHLSNGLCLSDDPPHGEPQHSPNPT